MFGNCCLFRNRYAIPDYETFSLLQSHIGSFKKVSDSELSSFPEQPTVRLISDLSDTPHSCPCADSINIQGKSTGEMDRYDIASKGSSPSSQFLRMSYYETNSPHSTHHRLCIINSSYSNQLLVNYHSNLSSIPYRIIPDKGDVSHPYCDLLLDIIPPQPIFSPSGRIIYGSEFKHEASCHSIKYACPESCLPKPYTAIPLNWLTDHNIWKDIIVQTDLLLTCSLSLHDLMSLPTAKAQHHISHHIHHHTMLQYLIKQIMKRRLEECNEKKLWPTNRRVSSDNNELIAKQIQLNASTVSEVGQSVMLTRRKVYGLIIWVASLNRIDMAAQQLQVLTEQFHHLHHNQSDHSSFDGDPWRDYIAGWVATEDIYPCRNGTSRAGNDYPNFVFYQFSNMNRKPLGWTCAQRRPMRALAHALLLFEPEFVLLVDDDTYVNMNLLLNSSLSSYIRQSMAKDPIVLGQLYNLYKTNVGKFSKKGFYLGSCTMSIMGARYSWELLLELTSYSISISVYLVHNETINLFVGGAGYLIGRAAIHRLVSHEVLGPPSLEDANRDVLQTQYLSILREALRLTKEHCPLYHAQIGDSGSHSSHNCVQVSDDSNLN